MRRARTSEITVQANLWNHNWEKIHFKVCLSQRSLFQYNVLLELWSSKVCFRQNNSNQHLYNTIILCSNPEICQFPVCYLGGHGFVWDQRWTASSGLGLYAGKGRMVFLLELILMTTPVISTVVCSSTMLKHSYLDIWRYKRGYSLFTLTYYCVLRVKWIIPSANYFLCKCIPLCFVFKHTITIHIWMQLVNVLKLFILLVSLRRCFWTQTTLHLE